MEWLKVKSKYSKSLTEYKFIGGTWFLMLLNATLLSGAFIPYFIVLCRGTLHPFLPLISQAAGSPPQSGIFNIFITLSSLLAFIGLNVLHMGIRIHMTRLNDDRVLNLTSLLNIMLLILGHVAIIGLVVVGSFPLDSYRTSDEWVKITIVPHAIGATCFFAGAMLYNMAITYLLFLIHPEQKQILRMRIFLNCLTTILTVLHLMTSYEGFWPSEPYPKLESCIISADSIHYNLSYLISSVSEWCCYCTLIVFFMTLKEEAKGICFTMTVTLYSERDDDDASKKYTPSITDHQEEKTEKQSKNVKTN